VRDEKYPVDGPMGVGTGHALGAGCAWLWSCGVAGRPVVRRYLWRGLRSGQLSKQYDVCGEIIGRAESPRLAGIVPIVSERLGHLDP